MVKSCNLGMQVFREALGSWQIACLNTYYFTFPLEPQVSLTITLKVQVKLE